MYKDKDKQREANRLAKRKQRLGDKGMTYLEPVIPKSDIRVIPRVQAMIDDVQANGGAYTFTTNKGKVQDVHRTPPKQQSHSPMMVGCVPLKEGT
ncbi:hypothetical protein LCGC14_0970500 [marine sediment metagenome]|uniref:Uncharacterized protein n=1 Tax=marine sediment metagenome TaxID=412755 RepID=A0A0F9NBW0_9ZZZZ